GGIISLNFAGFLIYYTGRWDYVFYSFAIFATINWTLFALLCYDNPRDHPFIGNEEKNFLEEKINYLEKDRKDKLSTPWIKIFTSKPMIAHIIHASVCAWMFNINNANLPKYMNDVLHISITKNAITSSVPKVAKLIIALFAGFLSDWMLEKKGISITKIRKIFVVLSSAFPVCFLMCASYAGCGELIVLTFFVLSTGFAGFSSAGIGNNLLDLAPNYIGPLAGFVETISKTTSIFSTYAVALLTPHAYLSEWRTVFWITFSAKILGMTIFIVWGSGEIQPWNNVQGEGSKVDSKTIKVHSGCSEICDMSCKLCKARMPLLNAETNFNPTVFTSAEK
ncbi:sialin-like, partial [Contarinia nasturtii]|uniref:sialin-like n=1 Tax=Contarinia nasturtii TaxID=265458 RepID=UPI0012D43E5A